MTRGPNSSGAYIQPVASGIAMSSYHDLVLDTGHGGAAELGKHRGDLVSGDSDFGGEILECGACGQELGKEVAPSCRPAAVTHEVERHSLREERAAEPKGVSGVPRRDKVNGTTINADQKAHQLAVEFHPQVSYRVRPQRARGRRCHVLRTLNSSWDFPAGRGWRRSGSSSGSRSPTM